MGEEIQNNNEKWTNAKQKKTYAMNDALLIDELLVSAPRK